MARKTCTQKAYLICEKVHSCGKTFYVENKTAAAWKTASQPVHMLVGRAEWTHSHGQPIDHTLRLQYADAVGGQDRRESTIKIEQRRQAGRAGRGKGVAATAAGDSPATGDDWGRLFLRRRVGRVPLCPRREQSILLTAKNAPRKSGAQRRRRDHHGLGGDVVKSAATDRQ